MKNKLRKIIIDDNTYLWKREHFHLTEFEYSQCVEKVTIYLEGFKNSPLQLLFRQEDNINMEIDINKRKWCVGYPEDGVIWLYNQKNSLTEYKLSEQKQITSVNLNQPAIIAKLIRYFILNQWSPRNISKPFIEENALKYLEIIDLT